MHAVPNRKYRIGRSKTGLGLYATKPYRKREYIVTYRGRRIRNEEADRLEARGSRYVFEINTRWTIEGIKRILALDGADLSDVVKVTVYLEETVIPQVVVTAGTATVQWTPAGVPPIGDDWITSDLSSICSNCPTFNKAKDTCTLTKAAVTTNYTVSSALCNNTNATGTIKIM